MSPFSKTKWQTYFSIPKFSSDNSNDEDTSFLENPFDVEERSLPEKHYATTQLPKSERARTNYIGMIIIFCLGALASTITTYLREMGGFHRSSSDRDCVAQLSVWSPLFEAVEYEDRNFNNSFEHKSPYRGPPTPEIEHEWSKLELFNPIGVTADKIALLNRSISDPWLMASDSVHKGEYIIAFETFHQLHCLNLIRQFTWLDHYSDPPLDLRGSLIENRMHVDHCIETLRLSLMCNADVTPFLIHDVETAGFRGKVDFSSFHKCKKWEPLVDWVKNHTWVPDNGYVM